MSSLPPLLVHCLIILAVLGKRLTSSLRCVTWLSSPCNLLSLCVPDWKLFHSLPVIKSPLVLFFLINTLNFMSKIWFATRGHFRSFPLNFCWYFHTSVRGPKTCVHLTNAVRSSARSSQLQLVFILVLGLKWYVQYCIDLFSTALRWELVLSRSKWPPFCVPLGTWRSKGSRAALTVLPPCIHLHLKHCW